jgi:hypothetical protein
MLAFIFGLSLASMANESAHLPKWGVIQPKTQLEKAVLPMNVDLVSPKVLEKTPENVTLKWKAEGADTFHVQVATDPRFKWLVIDDHYVKANSFDLKALSKGQQYFWRIAARKPDNDAGNTKGFFKTSSFEVIE